MQLNSSKTGAFNDISSEVMRKSTSYHSMHTKNFAPLKSGYTYMNFISDVYEFMIDNFENTCFYFIAPSSVLHEEENKQMMEFGLTHKLLWVVPIRESDFVYIEIVLNSVSDDLLKMYATDYVTSAGVSPLELDEVRDTTIKDLKQQYLRNTTHFLANLSNFISKEDNLQPIGCANSEDTEYVAFKGKVIPTFNVPLSQFVLIAYTSNRRVVDLYTRKGHEDFYKRNVGFVSEGFPSLWVSNNGSSLIVQGVVDNDRN